MRRRSMKEPEEGAKDAPLEEATEITDIDAEWDIEENSLKSVITDTNQFTEKNKREKTVKLKYAYLIKY